jgi:hypothetical protein
VSEVPKPTDESPVRAEELPALATDVVYEFGMMQHSGFQLMYPTVVLSDHGRNVLVEAFLMHVRNLSDFFTNDNPQKDDVVAKHYVKDWSAILAGNETAAAASASLKRQCAWINKRLAHLTATRQRDSKDTDARLINELLGEASHVFELLMRNLTPEQRGWFIEGALPPA